MSGRGSTRAGLPAFLPDGAYEPSPAVVRTQSGLVVDFVGEDARTKSFDIGALPLPQWHEPLAAAWAARTGPAGGLRTKASATHAWGALTRLVRFMAQTPRPPIHPGDLRIEHIDAYFRHRERDAGTDGAGTDLRSAAITFDAKPLVDMVSVDVRDRMRPRLRVQQHAKSGYSDGELARLVAAARSDVAALRSRLSDAGTVRDADERELLVEALKTGRVPMSGVGAPAIQKARRRVAEQVFVTRRDLAPMLVLLVATTGWNVEVIKELPSEHRVMEGLAVEVEVTKRRRGARAWHSTAVWEIGPPGKELLTPGGVYLLLHRLMAPARALLNEQSLWAVWQAHRRESGEGCLNPFAAQLDANLKWQHWTDLHGLRADGPTTGTKKPQGERLDPEAPPLQLNFNRLKTSVEVRRTRQLGGHLPSAARTNTYPVLFRNYLAGDTTTIDWAGDVVTEALVDVEAAAWKAHRRALTKTGGTDLRVIAELEGIKTSSTQGTDEASGVPAALDTAWAACTDHEHHPLTGRRCASSFLDCFHCGNCLITDDHLPRLLSLLDALETRRGQMTGEGWWHRYGPVWAAIRYEVLPKFSEAEVQQAELAKPADAMLDLVEPAWERP